MKKFLVLLYTALSFASNIAIIGSEEGDQHIAKYLQEQLGPEGHNVDVVWKNDNLKVYDLILSCNFKRFLEKYKHKTIITCFEPEVIVPEHAQYNRLRKFLGVFTWNHNLDGLHGFHKFYYTADPCILPDKPVMMPYNERKLACIINSHLQVKHPKELYSKRKEVAEFYNAHYPDDFSLYGKRGWDDSLKPVLKGPCSHKSDVFNAHKFTYCFENWDNNVHYVSEKIFNAFDHLCVPIYLGCTNISDFVPKEAFIDAREFDSYQEIHDFISNMDEETYMTYIDAIIKFSQSDQRYKFTQQSYREQVLKLIRKYI